MNDQDTGTFAKFLDPDETVLWTGRPGIWAYWRAKQGVHKLIGNIVSLVVLFVFLGVFFSIDPLKIRTIFEVQATELESLQSAAGNPGSVLEVLGAIWSNPGAYFGNPVFLILLVMILIFVQNIWGLICAPIVTLIRAVFTHYVVTPKRAMIISKLAFPAVEDFDANAINSVKAIRVNGSRQTLHFAEEAYTRKGRTYSKPIGFIGIKDARYVSNLLRYQFFGEGEMPVRSSAPVSPGVRNALGAGLSKGMSLDAIVPSELHPSEKILWQGRPDPKRYAMDAGVMLIALFGALFFLVSSCGALPRESSNGSFGWGGVPFIAIGLGLMGFPLYKFLEGRSTRYVLTDERAIIATSFRKTTVESIGPEMFNQLRLVKHDDGTASLYFSMASRDDGVAVIGEIDTGFVGLQDAEDVKRAFEKNFTIVSKEDDA